MLCLAPRLVAASRKVMQMETEIRSRNLLHLCGRSGSGSLAGLQQDICKGKEIARQGAKRTHSPVEDVQTQDLVRDREHHLRGGDAQLHAAPAAGVRDAAVGLAARPGEVDQEDGLVVLAEDGQRDVARVVVVQDAVHVVLVDVLQGSREVAPPALEELVRRVQLLLALEQRLPQRALVVEHLGRGADDDAVQAL